MADTRTIPEERTQFDYLLNALELASQADKPAEQGYAAKRRALFAYVRDIEAKAARSTARAPVDASAQEAAPQQGEILRFLLGEGPLAGVWFGDPHPTEQGAFWWRKHLRAAFAASLQQHDQQEGAAGGRGGISE